MLLLRCYLYAPWFVAASSLALIVYKAYNCAHFITYGYAVFKTCLIVKWEYALLKPNDTYICRTATLISRRYILNIYSTNIHTEYFKHAA